MFSFVPLLVLGSPPRMRGKLKNSGANIESIRITPAHAGKTKVKRGTIDRYGDHPRACGENNLLNWVKSLLSGSPPRMRGKLLPICAMHSQRRITPAHAGKTLEGPRRGSRKKDHPRACGENDAFPIFAPHSIGSPPRMRGKLTHDNCRVYLPRITPAHAGKT